MPKTRRHRSGSRRHISKKRITRRVRRGGYTDEAQKVAENVYRQISHLNNDTCRGDDVTISVSKDLMTMKGISEIIDMLTIQSSEESMGSKFLKGLRKPAEYIYGYHETATKSSTIKLFQELQRNGSATREDCDMGQFAQRLRKMFQL